MTTMLPHSLGAPSAKLANAKRDDNLSAGINTGFPILRIKGKVWSITRGGGEPHVLMRPDGDGPRNSVELAVLSASQYVSKVWYENGYEEGSTSPPDCFSPNGLVPDPSSAKKQNNTCADCEMNKWGSRITPSGKQGKACNDSKRVAVSPLGDIKNEAFGGPMMLRVPAASLTDFGNYAKSLRAIGHQYYGVGTKISFDPNEAYPKLVLEPIRVLTDQEVDAVIEMRASQQVEAILAEGSERTQEPAAEKPGPKPVTPQVTTAVKPKPTLVTTPLPAQPSPVDGFGGEPATKPKPTAKPAVKQVAAPTVVEEVTPSKVEASFEESLDAELDELLSENP